MTFDELIARWTKKSSGFRSSEFGIGKKEGIEELLVELRDLKQDARIAELTAEVARYKDDADTYRDALTDIAGWGQTSFGVGPLVEQMRNRARSAISVARNALKEGL